MYLAQVGAHSLSPRELLILGSRFWTWYGCPRSCLKCYRGGLAFVASSPTQPCLSGPGSRTTQCWLPLGKQKSPSWITLICRIQWWRSGSILHTAQVNPYRSTLFCLVGAILSTVRAYMTNLTIPLLMDFQVISGPSVQELNIQQWIR